MMLSGVGAFLLLPVAVDDGGSGHSPVLVVSSLFSSMVVMVSSGASSGASSVASSPSRWYIGGDGGSEACPG